MTNKLMRSSFARLRRYNELVASEGVARMQWLRNLPVSRKFIFAFGIVCGLCIVFGTYTFFTFRAIAVKSADVSEDSFPSMIELSHIHAAALNARREDLDLMLCTTPACTATHTARRQQDWADYQAGIKSYEPMISYPGERELYRQFTTAFASYKESSDKFYALLMAKRQETLSTWKRQTR